MATAARIKAARERREAEHAQEVLLRVAREEAAARADAAAREAARVDRIKIARRLLAQAGGSEAYAHALAARAGSEAGDLPPALPGGIPR